MRLGSIPPLAWLSWYRRRPSIGWRGRCVRRSTPAPGSRGPERVPPLQIIHQLSSSFPSFLIATGCGLPTGGDTPDPWTSAGELSRSNHTACADPRQAKHDAISTREHHRGHATGSWEEQMKLTMQLQLEDTAERCDDQLTYAAQVLTQRGCPRGPHVTHTRDLGFLHSKRVNFASSLHHLHFPRALTLFLSSCSGPFILSLADRHRVQPRIRLVDCGSVSPS